MYPRLWDWLHSLKRGGSLLNERPGLGFFLSPNAPLLFFFFNDLNIKRPPSLRIFWQDGRYFSSCKVDSRNISVHVLPQLVLISLRTETRAEISVVWIIFVYVRSHALFFKTKRLVAMCIFHAMRLAYPVARPLKRVNTPKASFINQTLQK